MKEEFRELPDLTDQDKNEVGKQQALIAKQMGINASTLKAFACKEIHGKVAYLFCPSDFDEFSRQSSLKSDLDQFSRQLSLELKNLHKINIIHFDLKLGNILVP